MGNVNKLKAIKEHQLKKDPNCYGPKETVETIDTSNLKGVGINLFEQLQAAMQVDLARLKAEKKLDDKIRIKTELLPGYIPFVDDYIENGHDYPCDVAVQVMIWLFDVGDIQQGLTLGLHLIAIGKQQMPSQFNRDIPTFIADDIYDWSNEQLKNKQTASPYLDLFAEVMQKSKWDLHPAVESKILVMMAKHHFLKDEFKQCHELCTQAEKANPEGAGVKTLKKKALESITVE